MLLSELSYRPLFGLIWESQNYFQNTTGYYGFICLGAALSDDFVFQNSQIVDYKL